MTKVRVGLVGTGVIAQVMHLHYLAELGDRFEVAAVCDLDGESARACAERYAIPAAFTDWRELVAHSLDAVMVSLNPASTLVNVTLPAFCMLPEPLRERLATLVCTGAPHFPIPPAAVSVRHEELMPLPLPCRM